MIRIMKSRRFAMVILTILLAICSATFFNQLITLIKLKLISQAYQTSMDMQGERTVAEKLAVSGILVPLIEEMIFRGVIYTRVKQGMMNKNIGRYVSVVTAGIISALLFGAYHGNLVQFVYAFFMGIIIVFIYECGIIMAGDSDYIYMEGLAMAALFHMSANIYVVLMGLNSWLTSNASMVISCIAGGLGMILIISGIMKMLYASY